MIAPRIISLDLDDTLWPVGPVIAAADTALLSWLRRHHPLAAHSHDVDSMRAMRMRVAANFPEQSHDMTFLRRHALLEQFTAAGYADTQGVVTSGVAAQGIPAPGVAAPGVAAQSIAAPGVAAPGVAAQSSAAPWAAAPGVATPVDEAMEVFFAARNRVQFYADVLPALERLRAKYRLFAISNGNADLGRCGVRDLFDGHVTASAAGAAKPDARIFAHLLREAGAAPMEVLHIGDDPLADVIGATRAGMQAVWLNRDGREWPSQFAPPLRTIATLAEVS